MSYSRTHKPSEAEKRLNSLRQQLYGKDLHIGESPKLPKSNSLYSYDKSLSSRIESTITLNDLTFLRADLFKILVLAVFGVGIQIIIFFSLRSNLIRLPF